MRILLIGSDNDWRMERAVERAFKRLGHETLLLDDRRTKRLIGRALTQKLLKSRARRFRPDFVFLSKCLALDLETVSAVIGDLPNAMWYHDPQWHADLNRPDIGHIAAVGRLARTFFVTGFVVEWRAHGLRAEYLPAAGDARIAPVPHDDRYGADISFIGTGYDPTRAELLADLARSFDVKVWGLGWDQWSHRILWGGRPVEGREFAAVCSSSRITIGINPARGITGAGYTSDRTWMVILAGAFYLGQRTPGLDALLKGGVHCGWYESEADCATEAARWLRDRDGRERVRAAGEMFVREHHTYDARVPHLLDGTGFVNPIS